VSLAGFLDEFTPKKHLFFG